MYDTKECELAKPRELSFHETYSLYFLEKRHLMNVRNTKRDNFSYM